MRSWLSDGRQAFWFGVAVLSLIRIFLAAVPLPPWVSLLSAILFIGGPIWALFRAAEFGWTAKHALLWLIPAAVVHVGGAILLRSLPSAGWATVGLDVLVQASIMVWTTGLGALVGLLIKDKNLILPVAIFLAGFDVFLVMTPTTFVAQTVEKRPEVFSSVAMKVPGVRPAQKEGEQPNGPQSPAIISVGPADLIFSMMFFVVLFRFKMRVKETAQWLAGVLVFYMALVLFTPFGMLPALVPIGATVLIVNAREFVMSRDEKIGVALATLLAIGLAWYGINARMNYKPPVKKKVDAVETTPTPSSGQRPELSPSSP